MHIQKQCLSRLQRSQFSLCHHGGNTTRLNKTSSLSNFSPLNAGKATRCTDGEPQRRPRLPGLVGKHSLSLLAWVAAKFCPRLARRFGMQPWLLCCMVIGRLATWFWSVVCVSGPPPHSVGVAVHLWPNPCPLRSASKCLVLHWLGARWGQASH